MKLRDFGILVLLLAIGAFIYWKYFKPEPPKPTPESALAATPAAIRRLSTLADKHIDSIFSPLDDKAALMPHQELRKLRENLADDATKASPEERPLYQTAIQLCDSLLKAVKERESSSSSLAALHSTPHSTSLSDNKDKSKDAADKQQLFETGIKQRWVENSKGYRDQAAALYKRLREEERKLNAQDIGDAPVTKPAP